MDCSTITYYIWHWRRKRQLEAHTRAALGCEILMRFVGSARKGRECWDDNILRDTNIMQNVYKYFPFSLHSLFQGWLSRIQPAKLRDNVPRVWVGELSDMERKERSGEPKLNWIESCCLCCCSVVGIEHKSVTRPRVRCSSDFWFKDAN